MVLLMQHLSLSLAVPIGLPSISKFLIERCNHLFQTLSQLQGKNKSQNILKVSVNVCCLRQNFIVNKILR